MGQVFERWDVTDWVETRDEPVGETTKYWLRPPDSDTPEDEWLWKVVKVEATGLERVLGHDWSERVATEVARRLDIPASCVQLAYRGNSRGVVSQTFAPHTSGLQLSNASLLLPNVVPGYDGKMKREVPGYTLDAAFEVLLPYGPPVGAPDEIPDGASAFAGYLMLDAVVGNQDRHHDNWGVIDAQGGERRIAPAFDQASCLGYQAPETAKEAHLVRGDVQSWARRGRSNHFEGRPNLVCHAVDALLRVPSEAAESWVGRLASIADGEWETMVEAVPDDLMSQVDRSFAVEVIRVNKRRVLDEWQHRS
jgi:hypothetical protein